jgi:hypothetical protein
MRNGFSCLAAFALITAASPSVAQQPLTPEDSVAAEALAARIVAIAQTLPKNAQQTVYEARFSVALANFNGKCNAALAALRMAASRVGGGAAQQAVGNMRSIAAKCEQGTGAGVANGNVGPNSVSSPNLPGLNTGGSANYLQ